MQLLISSRIPFKNVPIKHLTQLFMFENRFPTPFPSFKSPLSLAHSENEPHWTVISLFERQHSGAKTHCTAMQDIFGSVRRSLVFRTPGGDDGGFASGLVEKIGSSIRRSRIGLFSKSPVRALPPVPKDDASPIRWRKGELIGCGAFGRVYMGMNLDSGELLAVKQVDYVSISLRWLVYGFGIEVLVVLLSRFRLRRIMLQRRKHRYGYECAALNSLT